MQIARDYAINKNYVAVSCALLLLLLLTWQSFVPPIQLTQLSVYYTPQSYYNIPHLSQNFDQSHSQHLVLVPVITTP